MKFKKIFHYSLGPVSSAFISFVSVPVLTRLISPEDYGLISIAQVSIQLLVLFCLSGYDQGYCREFYSVKDERKLLLHTLSINIFMFSLLSIALYFWSQEISVFMFNEVRHFSLSLLAVNVGLLIALRYIHMSLRVTERALRLSVLVFTQALINFVSIVALLKLSSFEPLDCILLANTSSVLVIVLVSSVSLPKIALTGLTLDYLLLRKLTSYSLPLFISSLMMWILYSSDQYILKSFSNYDELGYYAAAYKLCAPLLLMQVIISTFWAPLSFKWAEEKAPSYYYERVINFSSVSLFIIFLLLIVASDFIIKILGEEYSSAVGIFIYLLAYPIFYVLSEVATVGISIARKTKYLVFVTAICAAINIIMNLYLVPIFGAKGAAVSTAVTFLVYFYMRLFFAKRAWVNLDCKSALLMSIGVVVVLYVSEFANSLVLPLSIGSIFASIFLYAYVERKLVLSSCLLLKKRLLHR
jgi:O-antigen/teichoic acid export membrane protein